MSSFSSLSCVLPSFSPVLEAGEGFFEAAEGLREKAVADVVNRRCSSKRRRGGRKLWHLSGAVPRRERCGFTALADAREAAADAIDQDGRACENERSPAKGLHATIHALLIAVDGWLRRAV